MACSAFTVGKLFPARYSCDTRLCSKLVHCSCMTLCSLLFDLLVMAVMFGIKKHGLEEDKKDHGCVSRLLGDKFAKAAKLLLTLSKSGGLAVSAIWVLTDLRILIDSAPGQGSLILGSIAAAASLLMLLVEFGFWLYLLPTALEQLGKVLADHNSGAGQDTSGPEVRMVGSFGLLADDDKPDGATMRR